MLATSILNFMFTYMLASQVLYGVPLKRWGSICHFQYTDDLIILTVGLREDVKDLEIIKLILYMLKGISSLAMNFQKTCLYLDMSNYIPKSLLVITLNYSIGLFSWRLDKTHPCDRVWLASWKTKFLSLRGKLILFNLVLSFIPINELNVSVQIPK